MCKRSRIHAFNFLDPNSDIWLEKSGTRVKVAGGGWGRGNYCRVYVQYICFNHLFTIKRVKAHGSVQVHVCIHSQICVHIYVCVHVHICCWACTWDILRGHISAAVCYSEVGVPLIANPILSELKNMSGLAEYMVSGSHASANPLN